MIDVAGSQIHSTIVTVNWKHVILIEYISLYIQIPSIEWGNKISIDMENGSIGKYLRKYLNSMEMVVKCTKITVK